ncbi:dihydroorotase [Methanocaldococcus indicus]|uniref:dihydroorotase n=1 Tax=Methanocaldococcus indicus TaxID=213231 RepID=UPI003C6D6AFD
MILKNCRIYLNNNFVSGEIKIEDGKIKRIAKIINEDDKKVDLKNNLVVPGVIDAHVHLRWRSKKEGFKSGSLAGINGGVCFVIDMPNDSPPITNKNLFYKKLDDAKKEKLNIYLNYGVTEKNYKENVEDAKAYKIFMVKSVGELYINDYTLLKDILSLNKFYCVHAEHKDIINENLKKYSYNSWLSHCLIRDNRAEYEAVKEIIKNLTNAKVHFCHISTKESINILKDAKKNFKITVEVTPHHLYLTKDKAEMLKGFGKVNPPLRDKEDIISLINGINNGVVDIIASDHAPHLIEEKLKDVNECPSGIPGLETLVPLTINLANKNLISLEKAISLISLNPAKIFNIDNEIKEGNVANLTVIDIKKEGKINPELFESRAKFSPFEGLEVKGFPVYTVVNGELFEAYGCKI